MQLALLEQDDRIVTRVDTRAEQLERTVARDGKPQGQLCSVRAKHVSVRPGIKHEQDQPIHATVALLERKTSIECLNVADPGFRLDSGAERRAHSRGVPCTKVVRDGKCDLGALRDRAVTTEVKPLEQGGVRRVTDRIAGGICADREIHAEHREHPYGHPDRHVWG